MNKSNTLIASGLLAVPFMCAGVLIGGVVMNKINNKTSNEGAGIWKYTAEIFKGELDKLYAENDKLKKELKEKEA